MNPQPQLQTPFLLQPSALSPPQLGRVRFSFPSLKPELSLHLKLVSPGFCTLERQHGSLVVLSLLTAVYVCAVTFWFWGSFNLQIHFPSEAPGLLHVSHLACHRFRTRRATDSGWIGKVFSYTGRLAMCDCSAYHTAAIQLIW